MRTTLRWWRRRRGLTQVELARRARIRQGTVSAIERGQPARLSTLARIARVLGTSPRNLIAEE